MNKAQRIVIGTLISILNGGVRPNVLRLIRQETEALNALPEKLKNGKKTEKLEEIISCLRDVEQDIESALFNLYSCTL